MNKSIYSYIFRSICVYELLVFSHCSIWVSHKTIFLFVPFYYFRIVHWTVFFIKPWLLYSNRFCISEDVLSLKTILSYCRNQPKDKRENISFSIWNVGWGYEDDSSNHDAFRPCLRVSSDGFCRIRIYRFCSKWSKDHKQEISILNST
jgi:hypothetical protein